MRRTREMTAMDTFREVDFLRFDDHAFKWRLCVLPFQPSAQHQQPLPAPSTSHQPTSTPPSSSPNLSVLTQHPSTLGGCYLLQTCSDRRISWRYIHNAKNPVLELVDFSLRRTLVDNALRIKLPVGDVACGVHLSERQSGDGRKLFLCVATTGGTVYVCQFSAHPSTSPALSIFSPAFSPVLQVVASETLESSRDAEVTCCSWLAHSGVEEEEGVGDGDGDGGGGGGGISVGFGYTSGCVKFMTVALSSDSMSSEQVTLEDSTLAQRLWSGIGIGILNRKSAADETAEAAGVVAMEIVKKQMVFLVALYADCKLRVWSVESESCTATLAVPFPKKVKGRSLRKGWLRRVEAGLFAVVSATSSASFGLLFSGSLKANSFSLSSSPVTVRLVNDEEQVRGTRVQLVEVCDDGRALSLWWSLSQPRKKLLFLYDLDRAKESSGPDQLLVDEGWGGQPQRFRVKDDSFSAAMQTFQSRAGSSSLGMEAAVEMFYVARLTLPDRFSCVDVAEGIGSCFGEEGLATIDRYLRDKTSRIEWPLLVDVAKELIRSQVRVELQETGGRPAMEETRCQVVGKAWERLLQDCEQAWSLKQMPTGLYFSVHDPTHRGLVRMNTVSTLRIADSLVSSKPSDLLSLVLRLSRSSQESALWRIFVHDKGPIGFRKEVDRAVLALPVEAFEGLQELAGNATQLHEQIQQLLTLVRSGDAPKDEAQGRKEDGTNSQVLAKVLHETVRQKARTRLDVALGLALLLSSLEKGVVSTELLLRDYWASLRNEDIQALRDLTEETTLYCFYLSMVASLGEELMVHTRRSSEWIFRIASHLHRRQHGEGDVLGKALFATGMPELHQSVLEAYILHLLGRFEALSADQVLSMALCDFTVVQGEGEEMPRAETSLQTFLYIGKQYNVLLDYCLRLREYTEVIGSDKRADELAILIAESRLWHVITGLEERGMTEKCEEMLLKTCGEFEAAAPREGTGINRLEYYMTVMKLMERARQPRLAVKFALYALEDDDCDVEKKGVLCSNIFARSLEGGDYKQALEIALAHPLGPERKKCVRQLVYALVDRAEIEVLCSLPLQTYGEEIWRVVLQALESKIDRADVSPTGKLTYFHVTYAFCINHCRFTTAASVMYDLAHQVEVAVHDSRFQWDKTSIKLYREALAACLTPLRLVGPSLSHATIIRPYPPMLTPTGRVRESTKSRQDSVMLTLEDVQSKFLLADVAMQLCASSSSGSAGGMGKSKRGRDGRVVLKSLANEVLLSAAIEAGMFEAAALLCERFALDATNLFIALTSHTLQRGNGDWEKLRRYLFTLDKIPVNETGKDKSVLHTYKYHEVVVRCVLESKAGMDLPLWLISSFGEWGQVHHGLRRGVRAFGGGDSDACLLLRLMLEYGRAGEAAALAAEMLGGMVSEALFDRQVMATPPHLPVKLLDQILMSCQEEERAQREGMAAALKNYLVALNTQTKTQQSVAMKYL